MKSFSEKNNENEMGEKSKPRTDLFKIEKC